MNIKDQIRAEIERRIRMNQTKNGFPAGTICAIRIEAYEHLRAFLDTFPEQSVEGLEEAAENYIAPIENDEGLDYINFSGRDIKDAFIAGAEWQKAKILEGSVDADVNYYECTPGGSYVEFSVDVPKPSEFSDKEKVKIIIVKED